MGPKTTKTDYMLTHENNCIANQIQLNVDGTYCITVT